MDPSYVSAGSKDISGMALIAQVNILSIHEILHSSDKKAVSVMGVHRMVKNCFISYGYRSCISIMVNIIIIDIAVTAPFWLITILKKNVKRERFVEIL